MEMDECNLASSESLTREGGGFSSVLENGIFLFKTGTGVPV